MQALKLDSEPLVANVTNGIFEFAADVNATHLAGRTLRVSPTTESLNKVRCRW